MADATGRTTSAALAATASLAASLWYLRAKTAKNKKMSPKEEEAKASPEEDCVRRQLNHVECQYQAVNMDPIVTMTWYEGDQAAMKEAIGILEERVRAIVKANPWLAGDLGRSDDHQQVFIKYPEGGLDSDAAVKKLFNHTIDEPSKLHHEMNILELRLIGREEGYTLRAFHDFENPLWRVSVVRSSKDEGIFGIAVSMSHFIGDGHTYYTVYNMLVAGKEVEALDDVRIENDEEQQAKIFTENELKVFNLPGFMVNMIHGTMTTQVYGEFFGWKSTKKYLRSILIDNDKVEAMKKAEMERLQKEGNPDGVKYVSTNDILTNWFFKNSGSRHCVMMVNLRNKLPDYKSNLAGNYLSSLYFRDEDVETPAMIRAALPKLKRTKTADQDLGKFEMMSDYVSIITTWASFVSKEVNLGSGCKQLVHVPCMDVGIRGGHKMPFCVVFQATPTHMGMLFSGNAEAMEGLKDPPFEATDLDFPFWGSDQKEVPIVGAGPIVQAIGAMDFKYLMNKNKK